MKLLKAKDVQKPSVSGGSFAHFSSCWEKWAAGGRSLQKKSTRRNEKKTCKEGTDSHDQPADWSRNDRLSI